ncbi:SDR family oxidoreductase [Streptomyces sp. NA04227]|uniref:SDR family oxidoreductase n=1 Tax=Streptomyces sp. NA04227 TaxID=2742136 RepID=UPI001590FA30|nr:SDR family oxidoreductase [Streptomyces sp. NA04227]QKW05130.1 SDR family oxidoreductase [Streptomyces sp. NA04227]
MQIEGSVALVTGANRGFGEQVAKALLERGASKVYAAARKPGTIRLEGVVPIQLDITDPAAVQSAAEQAPDVNLLINNAGDTHKAGLAEGELAAFRTSMDTHVFGTLDVSRTFAPVLARNGGGAMLNVLSILSWYVFPGFAGYCAAKAAAWSLTNSLRLHLADQKTLVTALHVAYMDTDMTKGMEVPKSDPAEVAKLALDGIEAGQFEIFADDLTKQVKAGLSADPSVIYPQLAKAKEA